jgi:L,D-transpeptidase ErfK/SrfK
MSECPRLPTRCLRDFCLVAGLLATLTLPFVAYSSDSEIRLVGSTFSHTVNTGETLGVIGSRFGVEPATLARLNGLQANAVIKVGQELRIDNRHMVPSVDNARLIINVPQRMLYLLDSSGILSFPIAVGRSDWRTPRGRFTVIGKEENPTWDVPESIQEEMRRQGKPVIEHMPPSPENPLGAYWIGLSIGGVGVHGTIAPLSIYRFVSHGCIRLHPDDIATLYFRVRTGMTGAIVYEPVLAAVIDGHVLVEVHRDAYRLAPEPMSSLRALAERRHFESLVDWAHANAVIKSRDGIAIDVTKAQ